LASERQLSPLTRLLDITRLLRRAGTPRTGVDRVELAYLKWLSAHQDPFYAVARTPFGYVLVDKPGAAQMARHFETGIFGPIDALGRLDRRRPQNVRRAEADLRRHSVARCLPRGLARMLRRHLPVGVRYLNTGHANFSARMVKALHGLNAQISVLIHDVIPLEAPQWHAPETSQRFAEFLQRVDAHADLIIYNSHDTQRRSAPWLTGPQDHVVAHLGVDCADATPLPPDLKTPAPYFLCLGTIEPRKNHPHSF